MNFKNREHLIIIFKIVLFCTLVYFPVFLHLDVMPIQLWDESRLAVNAFEMKNNGDYLLTYFEGSPDMWNTKPPLMIYMQSFFMQWLGTGELAVRLPSALAAFFTALAIMVFSIKYLKSYWFGIIATLVLLTSYGYIHTHAARTGDYDALLTLFTTVYALSFFLYLQNGNKRFLHLFFLALTLALMTKSIQATLFLPALFIYTLTEKKLSILKNKWFWINLLICILIVGGYYSIREYYDAGYLHYVWENEIRGRYMDVIEDHHEVFLYYFNLLFNNHFSYWCWLFPFGIITGLVSKERKIRKLTIYLTLLAITYWLVISFAQSKLEHYEMPLFPFLALIVALFIHRIFLYLKELQKSRPAFGLQLVPYIFLLLIFSWPYSKIIDKVYFPKTNDMNSDFYAINAYLQGAVKAKRSFQNSVVCYDGYNAALTFYIDALQDKKQNIRLKDWRQLDSGETVLAAQSYVKTDIEKRYTYQLLDSFLLVKKYRITGIRPQTNLQ